MPGELLQASQLIPEMEERMRERVLALTHPDDESERVLPQLAILNNNTDFAPSRKYVGLKVKLGAELGMATYELPLPDDPEGIQLEREIEKQNERDNTHGIIVQLPLIKPELTDHILAHIAPQKDVDGLGPRAMFTPVTPQAIKILMDGYEINYTEANVVLLGKGRLVGKPLLELLQKSGSHNIEAYDEHDAEEVRVMAINEADVIISSIGAPGLLTPDLFESLARPRVLIDAGTSEQGGTIVGDMSPELREAAMENDWRITPKVGGIGPITVHALLGNVITAAEKVQDKKRQAANR